MDQALYRIALTYEIADRFAEQLPPDYAEGTDIDSLADDRCLIAEPDFVLFPTVALPSDIDLSTLASRLSPVNLSKPAEIGITRDRIEQFGKQTRLLVSIRPTFDIEALQGEVAEYVRGVGGKILARTIPHIARRDIPQSYFILYDLSAPAAVRNQRSLLGRFRNKLAAFFRPDGAAILPFGLINTDASLYAETPQLTVSEVDSEPRPAIFT